MSEACTGWAVGLDDFTLLQIIGKGSYAKVLLARRTKTGMICALKVIKKARFRDQREHVFAER
jgi:serum/glucocorticoid-regulated kinase 2